jgi:hypothetical protein
MSDTVMVVLVVLGVALIAAGLLLTWRRSSVRPAVGAAAPDRARPISIGDELQAAPISEAVEDLVNQRLASLPGLAGTRVDFGTAADGSLEIWIGDQRYTSVDEIRDPRIRQAVADAVASYNK